MNREQCNYGRGFDQICNVVVNTTYYNTQLFYTPLYNKPAVRDICN